MEFAHVSVIYLKFSGKTYDIQIAKPVLSRWEHVGLGAQHTKANLREWKTMSVAIIKDEKSGSEKNIIARDLADYLDEKMILPRLHLLCAYDDAFISKHFKFLKHKDSLTGVHGFLTIHLGLYSYVMHHHLLYLSLHWKESNILKEFVRTYEMVQ